MGPTFLMVCVVVVAGWYCSPATCQTLFDGPLLSTFREVTQRLSRGPQGSYQFSFSLPQQERIEHRDERGKVTGTYSFVDKAGNEVLVNYDADHEGFRARSNSLPQPPQDTPDVAQAKAEFLKHYERTAQLLQLYSSEESGSSEENGEDEDSDESKESDENDGDDSSSSEEGVDTDEDEDDTDEDEEDEEEDDNVSERQGYKEEDSEMENDEGEGDEDEDDERGQETRLRFETLLPRHPDIPVDFPVSLTQKARRPIFYPSFLLQPRLEQTNFLSE